MCACTSNEINIYNGLQLILTVITAGLTLWIAISTKLAAQAARDSAKAAHDAADETHRAIQAQILSNLLDEYASPEMHTAIRTLTDWYDRQGDNLANSLQVINQGKIEMPGDVNESRRLVSHYIQKITIMWLRAGLLDKNTAMAALDRGQVRIYRELIEPLEWAITASYNQTSFELLGKEYHVPRRTIPGLDGWNN